jgi:hypothetical protein
MHFAALFVVVRGIFQFLLAKDYCVYRLKNQFP